MSDLAHRRGRNQLGLSRFGKRKAHAVAELLEGRRLLSTSTLSANDAIAFQQIVIDKSPGTVPVVKRLVDITNSGHQDAVIGHESTLGGGGLFWYQYPVSGNPSATWSKYTIDAKADVYESICAADISGHVDAHGNPVNDLVVCERGTVVWYENPLGDQKDPTTSAWTKHVIGTISQGDTHEMYLADLDGDGQLDVVCNTSIFFRKPSGGWIQIATANYNRTEKGLSLFDSGSGLGAIDLLGTGNSPNFQLGWYENPRDAGNHTGNAQSDPWVFHPIGPAYGNYVTGDGISYAAMDVNGDGHEDIITCDGEYAQGDGDDNGGNALTGGLIWWQSPANPATGTWIKHTIDASLDEVHNLIVADMNGDGTPEILTFEQDQSPLGRLMIIYNEGGTGQNWLEQVIASDAMPASGGGTGGQNEGVGDANSDGSLDILTSPHGFYSQINPISLYLNLNTIDAVVKPKITSASGSTSVNAGGSVTFAVSATGTGPLTYQWQQNGADIAGANASSYTITSAPASDDQSVFRCIVGNPAGLIPSPGATLSVVQGPQTGTTTKLTKSTTAAIRFGQSVTFTAALSPVSPGTGTPTGTVTFMDGATPLGTGSLSGGLATLTTASMPAGVDSITAVYGGDANFAASTSSAVKQTVQQSGTTAKLTKNTTTSIRFGQRVTFTATLAAVAPGAGTPSGTVTFKDGSTTLGTAMLSGGVATFATSSLPVASNSITAIYGGDTDFTTSTSSSVTQTVNKSSTTTQLSKSTTTPIRSGQSVTFTATLVAVSPARGRPRGSSPFSTAAAQSAPARSAAGSRRSPPRCCRSAATRSRLCMVETWTSAEARPTRSLRRLRAKRSNGQRTKKIFWCHRHDQICREKQKNRPQRHGVAVVHLCYEIRHDRQQRDAQKRHAPMLEPPGGPGAGEAEGDDQSVNEVTVVVEVSPQVRAGAAGVVDEGVNRSLAAEKPESCWRGMILFGEASAAKGEVFVFPQAEHEAVLGRVAGGMSIEHGQRHPAVAAGLIREPEFDVGIAADEEDAIESSVIANGPRQQDRARRDRRHEGEERLVRPTPPRGDSWRLC